MKTYLEYEDEKSSKFWEIIVSGPSHTVRFGKIGAKGQSKVKEFSSDEQAIASADKLVAQKKKKGYLAASGASSVSTLNTPSENLKPAMDDKQVSEVKGAVFFRDQENVNANTLIAKLREDGKTSRVKPRSLSGFGNKGLVAVAVQPVECGYWTVVDSADGAQGIGAGDWSRVALMANHLGTDAIWYRKFSTELALAAVFRRGSQGLEVCSGTDAEVRTKLESEGVPLASVVQPADCASDAVAVTIKYEADKYRTGPDASTAGKLVAVRDALRDGNAERLRTVCESLHGLEALALGVIRGAPAGEWETCLRNHVRAGLAHEMVPRSKLKEPSLDEVALKRVAQLAAAEDDDFFMSCVDRLNEIEVNALQQSRWAKPYGLHDLSFCLQQARLYIPANYCLRLILQRSNSPEWTCVNQFLRNLLMSTSGTLQLSERVREVIGRCEKRSVNLGKEAQDAIYYNLACVYSRAGDPNSAMTWLRMCRSIHKQNSAPDKDTDLRSLWTRSDFVELLQPSGPPQLTTLPLARLKLSKTTSRALAALGVGTIGELLGIGPDQVLSPEVVAEMQRELTRFGIQWRNAQPPSPPATRPPPKKKKSNEQKGERAVHRQTIALHDDDVAGSQLVSRFGGLPCAPSDKQEWPASPNRPMQFILQLVSSGSIELGDITLIQVFADLEGDYYDSAYHTIRICRGPCDVVLAVPSGVEVLPVKTMSFAEDADDRVLDVEDPDDEKALEAVGADFDTWEDANSYAWADKIWGIPIGANLNRDERDSRGTPMKCLFQLVSYDDWFLWYGFISEDLKEARLQIVRG